MKIQFSSLFCLLPGVGVGSRPLRLPVEHSEFVVDRVRRRNSGVLVRMLMLLLVLLLRRQVA